MENETTGYLRVIATQETIVGEVDTVTAIAQISGFTRNEDGTLTPEWAGESDVDWDSQTARRDEAGEILYMTYHGDFYPASACEFVAGDPDDPDDQEDKR